MKRMHIHVGVEHLDQAVTFYSALFGAQPVKIRSDYAKWMLDEPCVNFAISTRAGSTGLEHLGIQVEEEGELGELRQRLQDADLSLFDEGETVCCYARSDKTWVQDPAGIAWEAYRTMEEAQFFGSAPEDGTATETGAACCAPPQARETADEPAAGSGACCV